jgi:hypothetical protein
MNVKVVFDIPEERVQDLLCNALEGGSNYWYLIEQAIYPHGETKASLKIEFEHLELPFKGGTLVFSSLEEPEKEKTYLTLAIITDGLQLMANKYPKHFADFLSENDDATTGDIFLQCCLFKEVIYD